MFTVFPLSMKFLCYFTSTITSAVLYTSYIQNLTKQDRLTLYQNEWNAILLMMILTGSLSISYFYTVRTS